MNSINESLLIEKIQKTGRIVEKLAQNEKAFREVVAAYRTRNASAFQSALKNAGYLEWCYLICEWLCYKECVIECQYLCPTPQTVPPERSVDEMLEFARASSKLIEDKDVLAELVAAVRAKDAKRFQAILKEYGLLPYCVQVCAWFCLADCRCNDMCPPPPIINKVGDIMTSQPPYFVHPSWNATTNFAEGPSETVGPVPAANCAAGVGDHPFGGWAKINGLFNVEAFPFLDLTQYKVEYSTSVSGPWTPILGSVQDAYIDYGGIYTGYTRLPVAGGWYNIQFNPPPPFGTGPDGMGVDSEGMTYLTNWDTSTLGTGLYYLKLTVMNTSSATFESPVLPVQIDNDAPTIGTFSLSLKKPDGTVVPLGCCNSVNKGDGLILITFQASDQNFQALSLDLEGGCSSTIPVYDQVTGALVDRNYNCNIADHGEPAVRTVVWDPWDPLHYPVTTSCCYLVTLEIWDRAIVNNYYSGGHYTNSTWISLLIGA
ncbi:MAG: hypothetical protein ABSB40_13515 [Nitrososphaeria archaeon]